MYVTGLTVDGFRNLAATTLQPREGVNIFHGDNAQGKTNLLEALWLFTGGRSFRGAKDKELKNLQRDAAHLTLSFYAEGRPQEATLDIESRRKATLNGLPLKTASGLAGKFCAVVFSPAHLSLIKDGPEARRRFIDAAYCPLRPGYIHTLSEYSRALTQRNALLKNGMTDEGLLGSWDENLALLGARVVAARRAYIKKLLPEAAAVYDGLSGGREQLTLTYDSVLPEGELKEVAGALLSLLREKRREDLAAGFTTVGPHREDLTVEIDGLSARSFGSQGQQRSAVLALKLAEATLLRQVTGEQPVVLLDDVMSELDPSRQDYILNQLHGWQVFITCCEPSSILRLTGGTAFHIAGGVITPPEKEESL